jgi:hypothetical protein
MTDGLDNLRGTAMWFMDERRLNHWSRLAHGGSAHQRLLVVSRGVGSMVIEQSERWGARREGEGIGFGLQWRIR